MIIVRGIAFLFSTVKGTSSLRALRGQGGIAATPGDFAKVETVNDGLVRLFDLARKHLDAEHIWREEDEWPMEEAEHGFARQARPRPELKLPPLHLTA